MAGTTAFAPFGETVAKQGISAAVGYQGDWTDPGTDAVNMHARWYLPGLGAFSSRDSFDQPYSGAESLNRYSYVGGNPLSGIDLTGQFQIPGISTEAAERALATLERFAEKKSTQVVVRGTLRFALHKALGPVGWAMDVHDLYEFAKPYFNGSPSVRWVEDEAFAPDPRPTPAPPRPRTKQPQPPPPAPHVINTVTHWTMQTWTNTEVSHTVNTRTITVTGYARRWEQIEKFWSNGLHQWLPETIAEWVTGVERSVVRTIDPARAVDQVVQGGAAQVDLTGTDSDSAGHCGLTGSLLSCLGEVVASPVGGLCAGLSATTRSCVPGQPEPGNPAPVREATGAGAPAPAGGVGIEPVQAHLDGGCHQGGNRRSDGTRSGQIWSCNDPSHAAAQWQGSESYPGVDKWETVWLPKGAIVHAGEPGVSGFFISQAAADQVGHDATKLNEGIQVGARRGLYRPGLTAFRVTGTVAVARSIALANPQYGAGGLEQYFIPNWEQFTEPVVSRVMGNRDAR